MDAGWALLLRAVEEEDYDPACERIDTAIKALWLLYIRGKWQFLAELGLRRTEIEPIFSEFDSLYITVERGRIYREDQVIKLLRSCPEPTRHRILSAAMEMVRRYMVAKKTERHAYYERDTA